MIRNPVVKAIVASLASLTASAAAAVNLGMHDAAGEGKTTLPDGRPAIVFDTDAPNGAAATWKLASPLNAGWHAVEIGFGPEQQSRKLVQFECLDATGAAILSVNLYHAPSLGGSGGACVMGFYLTQEAITLRWRKNQQRAMKSAPLVTLRIFDGRPATGTAFMEAVALKPSGNSFLLPTDPGGGHMRVVTPRPVRLRWTQVDGRSFETPSGNETHAWLAGDLTGLEWLDADPGLSLLERRFESPTPVDPSGLERPLIPLQTGKRSRHVIDVHGQDLDPAKVTLADYLCGARMAAVLSWDDGIPQDKRAAELMHRHGWRASFFFNHHSPMVGRWKELEDLGMEVGSHSWSHPFYPLQSPRRCRDESVMMRKFLESKVNHPVISFAYPFNYGPAFDAAGDYVVRAQQDAAYLSGRSTMVGPLALDALGDPLAMRTDGHFLMGPEKIEAAWQAASRKNFGIFYIWGHTYEIVKEEDWKSFEDLLRKYGGRPEAWYASQGDLMVWKLLREETRVTATGDATQMRITIDAPEIHPWWSARVPLAVHVPGSGIRAESGGEPLALENGDVQIPAGLTHPE